MILIKRERLKEINFYSIIIINIKNTKDKEKEKFKKLNKEKDKLKKKKKIINENCFSLGSNSSVEYIKIED